MERREVKRAGEGRVKGLRKRDREGVRAGSLLYQREQAFHVSDKVCSIHDNFMTTGDAR